MSSSFRDVSIHLTSILDKETKQGQGIFFTPKEARTRVIDAVKGVCPTPSTILEPSFGSGEFLEDLYVSFPSSTIVGIERNPVLFASSPRPNIHNMDFLDYHEKHEVIVGNPPYFVMKKSKDTEICQSGRPNIFVQFLYKAVVENLSENGILAFVLPTSFFNCIYYERMRQWLYTHVTILNVELLPGTYLETQQDTFLLLLRNTQPQETQRFFFHSGEHIYLTPHFAELSELVKGAFTLAKLDCSVKTGEVVWNQEKDKLSDDGTLLIYSSNISSGTLLLGNLNLPKKQYISGCTRSPMSGRAILINRGYGNSKYKLNPVLIDQPSFYCENHVNVIRAKDDVVLDKIIKSLQDPRTTKFIDLFVGNGALSKTEIESCLPIWLD